MGAIDNGLRKGWSMHLDWFQKYLIAINIIAFVKFTVSYVKYLQSDEDTVPGWLSDMVITVIGGALGALLAMLLWDRKVDKMNITWRIFDICMVIIHIIVYLFIYGIIGRKIKWEGFDQLVNGVIAFGKTHIWLGYYLLVINLATFIAFAVDKVKAIKGAWRTRELTLLLMSFFGGTIGGLIGMYTLRHKIRSPQFSFGLYMILIVQLFMLAYWVIRTI